MDFISHLNHLISSEIPTFTPFSKFLIFLFEKVKITTFG